jgi:WYL domain
MLHPCRLPASSLGAPDIIVLAHHARVDLGWLAMALTRVGIACLPDGLFDMRDISRRISAASSNYRIENAAATQQVLWELSTAHCLTPSWSKTLFFALLQRTPTVKKIADLVRLSPLLIFADAPVFSIDPPAGFEVLAPALTERCPIIMVYKRGMQGQEPRKITSRLVLEVQGVAYVVAHCHQSGAERTFRLDRIQQCWLE